MDGVEQLINKQFIGKTREHMLEKHRRRKTHIEKTTQPVSRRVQANIEAQEREKEAELAELNKPSGITTEYDKFLPGIKIKSYNEGVSLIVDPRICEVLPGGEIKYYESHR